MLSYVIWMDLSLWCVNVSTIYVFDSLDDLYVYLSCTFTIEAHAINGIVIQRFSQL